MHAHLAVVMQVAIMAIITGTMFLRTRIEPNSVLNGSMYMSVCFYSVMIMMFNGLTEMTIAVRRSSAGRAALHRQCQALQNVLHRASDILSHM